MQNPDHTLHAGRVAGMFGRIAGWYDFLNHFLSLGQDIYWRYRLVRMLRPGPTGRTLDLAAGTLDVSLEILRQLPGTKVLSMDFAAPMLKKGKKKLKPGKHSAIQPVLADGRSIPLPTHSVDNATIAFGIRNIKPREDAYREMYRVIVPGGRMCILEFGSGRNTIWKGLYNFYLNSMLPFIGRVFSGDEGAYKYLADTICEFPTAGDLADEIRAAGFERVFYVPLLSGIVNIHVAEKSATAEAPAPEDMPEGRIVTPVPGLLDRNPQAVAAGLAGLEMAGGLSPKPEAKAKAPAAKKIAAKKADAPAEAAPKSAPKKAAAKTATAKAPAPKKAATTKKAEAKAETPKKTAAKKTKTTATKTAAKPAAKTTSAKKQKTTAKASTPASEETKTATAKKSAAKPKKETPKDSPKAKSATKIETSKKPAAKKAAPKAEQKKAEPKKTTAKAKSGEEAKTPATKKAAAKKTDAPAKSASKPEMPTAKATPQATEKKPAKKTEPAKAPSASAKKDVAEQAEKVVEQSAAAVLPANTQAISADDASATEAEKKLTRKKTAASKARKKKKVTAKKSAPKKKKKK